MPSWTLSLADTFHRANGGIGANYTVVRGSDTISSNTCVSIPSASGPFTIGSSYAYYVTTLGRDARVVLSYLGTGGGTVSGATPQAIFRSNGSTTYYAVQFNVSSHAVQVWKVIAGTQTNLNSASITAPTQTDNFTIDFDCYGVNPTVFDWTVTDTTTSTVIGTGTFSETSSSITSTTGFAGFSGDVNAGGTGQVVFTEADFYTGTFAISAFGASASTAPTATAVALTGTASGGTPTYTTTIKSSLTSNSFGGAAIFTGSSLAPSFTDSSPLASPGGEMYYRLTIVDSAGSPVTITADTAIILPHTSRVIGFIGDSIYSNGNVTATFAASLAIIAPLYPCTINNQAVTGTTSADWLGGGANLPGAITAFTGAGVTDVLYMIGTNDSKFTAISQATYKSNVANTCAALNAVGINVYLMQPPTPMVINATTPASWDSTAPGFLALYSTAQDQLVNNTGIRLGDREGQSAFAANAQVTNYTFDNIHPQGGAGTGGPALAYLQAAAYARSAGLLGTLPSGGGFRQIALSGGING